MTKNKSKKNPFSLRLDTIRRLSDDTLVTVKGGDADPWTQLKCPEKTWGGSKSRSIVH